MILEKAGLFSVAEPFSVFQPAEGTVLAVGMSKLPTKPDNCCTPKPRKTVLGNNTSIIEPTEV